MDRRCDFLMYLHLHVGGFCEFVCDAKRLRDFLPHACFTQLYKITRYLSDPYGEDIWLVLVGFGCSRTELSCETPSTSIISVCRTAGRYISYMRVLCAASAWHSLRLSPSTGARNRCMRSPPPLRHENSEAGSCSRQRAGRYSRRAFRLPPPFRRCRLSRWLPADPLRPARGLSRASRQGRPYLSFDTRSAKAASRSAKLRYSAARGSASLPAMAPKR